MPKKNRAPAAREKMKVSKHFPFKNLTSVSPKCQKFRACGGLIHHLQTDPNDAASLISQKTLIWPTNKGGFKKRGGLRSEIALMLEKNILMLTWTKKLTTREYRKCKDWWKR